MASQRGRYPSAILAVLWARGKDGNGKPIGATTDEIIHAVQSALPVSARPSRIDTGWGIRAALNRMSKPGGSLAKTYEYKTVRGNVYGTRVYRYTPLVELLNARPALPSDTVSDTERRGGMGDA